MLLNDFLTDESTANAILSAENSIHDMETALKLSTFTQQNLVAEGDFAISAQANIHQQNLISLIK